MFDPTTFMSGLHDFVPRPLLFASVSGAHLYGVDSPDSDVDLRVAYETSPLPQEPQNRPALNDVVVRMRMAMGAP